MPEWADSLSKGVGTSRSRVDVDLARRLREEEARIARERAEAARRAAEKVARRQAAEEAARRQAAQQAASAEAARRPKRVSKWPSMLAAAVVILLGAFVGQRIISSDEVPQQAGTPYPIVTAPPAESNPPETTPAKPPAGSGGIRLDTYTVKPGDTLESIAQQFDRTPVEVSQANGAYGGLIRIRTGQVINIP